ncbi:hypothetical protein EX30DRAFT_341987 [Ascodesmis nigricans]|uniref:Uncharacterized protein n=1 Tax=Ascodesmis nigricans TaxID=341454 RepID=A0A4S2MTQ9_9PEZI|nr:hypothetical protein EX30DRAFT_341987 [Ascodesmis nigricans]
MTGTLLTAGVAGTVDGAAEVIFFENAITRMCIAGGLSEGQGSVTSPIICLNPEIGYEDGEMRCSERRRASVAMEELREGLQ